MSAKRSLVRISAAEKRQAVIGARAAGNTWAKCAEMAGYGSPESAQRAFNTALALMPKQTIDELVAEETARLEMCDAKLSEIIANPPVKTTSIGRTQWDVRTCTCCVKARTDRDHADGCAVQPVTDQAVVVACVRERRLVGESLRRMRGADRPSPVPDAGEAEIVAEAMSYVRDLTTERDQLRAEVDRLRDALRMLDQAAPAEVVTDSAVAVRERAHGNGRGSC